MFVGPGQPPKDSKLHNMSVTVPFKRLGYNALLEWLHKEHVAPLVLLQAAWAIVLRYYSGSDDISFGCRSSQRECTQLSSKQFLQLPNMNIRLLYKVTSAQPVRKLLEMSCEEKIRKEDSSHPDTMVCVEEEGVSDILKEVQ